MKQKHIHGPALGFWKLVGFTSKTNNEIEWQAILELLYNDGSYSGVLAWKRDGKDVGTEVVTCNYDVASNTFTMKGESVTGAIFTAEYQAVLSSDGKSLTDGTWMASCGTGATWQAKFVND